jgi:hypothetical protein
MNRMKWIVLVLLGIFLAGGVSFGDDWPQFRGPNRDGKSVEGIIVELDKMTGRTIWVTNELNGSSAYCSPILFERGWSRLPAKTDEAAPRYV